VCADATSSGLVALRLIAAELFADDVGAFLKDD
jgi:hypothetical protein